MNTKTLKSNEVYSYSELGYEENYPEIVYDYDRKLFSGGFLFLLIMTSILISTVPYLGVAVTSFLILYTLQPKFIRYYAMKWKKCEVTDEKVLKPVFYKIELDSEFPKRNYLIFFSLLFIVSSYYTKNLVISIVFLSIILIVSAIIKNKPSYGTVR